MRIKWNELKKITASPIIYALLSVFIVLNIVTIAGNACYRNDFKVLNTIVDKFGYKVNYSMLAKFKKYYTGQLDSMNALSKERTGRCYKSAYAFLQDDGNYKTGLYSQKEFNDIKRLNTVENYYTIASGIDSDYSKIDIKAMGESDIKKYGLSGESAATARGEYKELAVRFSQLKANEEEKALFFIGLIYSMHSFLFANIFRLLIFEIMILAVLITSQIVNFEFENRTQLLAYSSKRGRKFILDKLAAAVVMCLAVTTVLIGVTLTVYFCFYDYSRVYNVPIATAFLSEPNQLYIPWFNLSFIQYLFAVIAVVYAAEIIFMAIAFCIATLLKNNYIVFAVFALIFCVSLNIPSFIPRSSNLSIASSFNPFALVLNPHVFFMEKEPFSNFKYYEMITLGVWAVLLTFAGFLCVRHFKKSDIY